MDESRKAFEKWAESNGHDTYRSVAGGGYYFQSTQWAWDIWQESRETIEIELLPTVDSSNVPFAGNAWNAYRSEAVKAIRAAGIKVKE